MLTKLNGKEDGTFLVAQCISGDNNDYSLAFRQNGQTRCVQVFNHSGRYSLSEHSMYESIPELVKHYKSVPLDGRNPRLNVTLGNPIRKVRARLHDYPSLKAK